MEKTLFTFDDLQEAQTINIETESLLYHNLQFLNPQCLYVYDTYEDDGIVTCVLNLVDDENNTLVSMFIGKDDEIHFKLGGIDTVMEIVQNGTH